MRLCSRCGLDHYRAPYRDVWRCDHEAKLEAVRERRRRARADRSCESCGATFTPPRSDGRYCSGACRQRAHRQRKRAEETPAR